jgi:hypothetical protein
MQRFLYVVSKGSHKHHKIEQVTKAAREVAFFVLVKWLF